MVNITRCTDSVIKIHHLSMSRRADIFDVPTLSTYNIHVLMLRVYLYIMYRPIQCTQ